MAEQNLSQDRRALILRWIEEQEALASAAHDGPWEADLDVYRDTQEIEAGVFDRGINMLFLDGTGYSNEPERKAVDWPAAEASRIYASARFIAASRSVLPLALAALRAALQTADDQTVNAIYQVVFGA